jgi:hypothetical protein
VLVVVLDTGFDLEHEDLRTNLLPEKYHTYKGYVGDEERQTDPWPASRPKKPGKGEDGTRSETETKADSHGTHVAGIIGGVGNNALGITGVCWRVPILVHRVNLGSAGVEAGKAEPSTAPDFLEALIHLVEVAGLPPAGRREDGTPRFIVNCSFAFPPGKLDETQKAGVQKLVSQMVNLLQEQNVLFVLAAGNEGEDLDNTPTIWSELVKRQREETNLKGAVITVMAASVADDGQVVYSRKSNYGATTVDLAAPGEKILSTVPSSPAFRARLEDWPPSVGWVDPDGPAPPGYGRLDGSSMAAPHVAGAAALTWAHPLHRKKTPLEIKKLILSQCRVARGLAGRCAGNRMLDLGFLDTVPKQKPRPWLVTRPEEARASFLAGRTDYVTGDYRAAIGHLRAALDADPTLGVGWYYLAFCHARVCEDDRATEFLQAGFRAENRYPVTPPWEQQMERFQGYSRWELSGARRQARGPKRGEVALAPGFWGRWRADNR